MNREKQKKSVLHPESKILFHPSGLATFLFLILLSSLTACSSSSHDKSHVYRILKHRQIIKSTFVQANKKTKVYNFSIVDGSDLVFSYSHIPESTNGPSNNTNKSIVFQINPDLTSFSYKNAQLDSLHAFYMQDGSDLSQYPIYEGTISGKKIGKSDWNIHMNIHVQTKDGMINQKINHTFNIEVIK